MWKNNLCLCIWQRNPPFHTFRWSASTIFLFIICKCNEWTEKKSEINVYRKLLVYAKNIIKKMKYENLNFPHTQINKAKMHWQRNLIVRIYIFVTKIQPQKKIYFYFSISHFHEFICFWLKKIVLASKFHRFYSLKFNDFSKDNNKLWCPL